MKNIVIGIGNTILCDDRIGIYIARKLKHDLEDIEIEETSLAGINLLELINNYSKAIFIDSMKTGKYIPGDVNVFHLNDFKNHTPFSIHSTDFVSAIRLAKIYGMELPGEIYFIGIEIKDNFTFKESFTEEIESMKEVIYGRVKEKINGIVDNRKNGGRRP